MNFFFFKFKKNKIPVLSVLTLDYETWQPIPLGYLIDWQKDVFIPTQQWMNAAAKTNSKLTFFIEMGEYYWLKCNQPELALQMEQQIQDMVRWGHGVELHLHPAWLPEFGVVNRDGIWSGLDKNQRLHDIPLNIEELIKKAKNDLEAIVTSVKQDYKVTTFRTANFQIQPSELVANALLKAGIKADSSVCPGEYEPDFNYDFRLASHQHQPYRAKVDDVNVIANANELSILEIPIFTRDKTRWSFDNQNADYMLNQLYLMLSEYGYSVPVSFQRKLRLFFTKKKKINTTKPLVFTGIAHTKYPQSQREIELFFENLAQFDYIKTATIADVVKIYEQ